MIIGRVIGHVWATKKEESLSGQKLMIVQRDHAVPSAGFLPKDGGCGDNLRGKMPHQIAVRSQKRLALRAVFCASTTPWRAVPLPRNI
mgnify:CR=1 FL=1